MSGIAKATTQTILDVLSNVMNTGIEGSRERHQMSLKQFTTEYRGALSEQLMDELRHDNDSDPGSPNSDILERAEAFFVSGIVNNDFSADSDQAKIETRRFIRRAIIGRRGGGPDLRNRIRRDFEPIIEQAFLRYLRASRNN